MCVAQVCVAQVCVAQVCVAQCFAGDERIAEICAATRPSLSWFAHDVRSHGINGQYTLFNTLTEPSTLG